MLQGPRPANSVIVELVIDRSFKDDCRAHTGTVWRGKGDQQYFPAALWPKLAEHPDVWKLVSEEGVTRPSDITAQEALRREAEAAAKLDAERAELRRLEDLANGQQSGTVGATQGVKVTEIQGDQVDAAAAQLRSDEAAGNGTDLVTALVPDVTFADSFDYAGLTQEKQDAMSVDELRELAVKLDYGLHPRLGEGKLRPQFAALTAQRLAQLDEESDTTGVDDGVVPIPAKE